MSVFPWVLILLSAVLTFTTVEITRAAPAVQAPAEAVAPAAQAPLDAEERRLTVEDLAKKLEDNFVFPDVARRYAAMLRANLASGAYEGLTDPKAFGEKVTADLQAVSSDGHLRLAPADVFGPPKASPTAQGAPPVFGLEEAKMIGDVAYLRYNGFPGDPARATPGRTFLLAHADAKAVIIDSRGNHGGGLAVMDAILPLLYAKPTVLVRMDTRAQARGPFAAGGPTLQRESSPSDVIRLDHHVIPDSTETRLQRVPVYYLTSSKTASAAEHLALAFKRTHRAVLVGETTRGAGHFGGVMPIGKRFAAFIPVGRTYDPDTNWDWEGKGVAPDVAVPADQALDEALKEARAAGANPG